MGWKKQARTGEFLIFTGDGDFEYLIRKVVEKGTKVYIIFKCRGKKTRNDTKRLSTKTEDLVNENRGKINLINIDSWKMKIKKEI